MMLLLLLALAGEPAAPQTAVPQAAAAPAPPADAVLLPTRPVPADEAEANLQSCEMTKEGWVCRYRMPPVTLLGSADGKSPPVVVFQSPPATAQVIPVPISPATPPKAHDETDRQARLIAKCADAPWWSLCLPDDRRAAKKLQSEKAARETLRADIARDLSEKRCDDAVQRALKAGDLELAREAKSFCSP